MPQEGDTPLINASFAASVEVVRVLLKAGADKEAKRQVKGGVWRVG